MVTLVIPGPNVDVILRMGVIITQITKKCHNLQINNKVSRIHSSNKAVRLVVAVEAVPEDVDKPFLTSIIPYPI